MKTKAICIFVMLMLFFQTASATNCMNEEQTITYDLVYTENLMLTNKNLIAIPLDSDIKTAFQLMTAIGSNCDAINRWNPETQAWEGWISRLGGIGVNFEILPDEAYEISVSKDTTFSITGTPSDIKPLYLIKPDKTTSKNYIALPYDTTISNADELLHSIPNCDTVNRWNPETQRWEGYINLFGGMGTNFPVRQGEGYLITVTENTIWTPL